MDACKKFYFYTAAQTAAGAVLTGVSGYGSGYYIQFDATEAQAETINNRLEAETV